MTQQPQTFGARLRQHRKARGLSQYKVAEITGLHFTAISRLENGHNMPTAATLEKLKLIGFEATTDEIAATKHSLERRLTDLEQQMDTIIEDLLERVAALENKPREPTPSEAREMLVQLSQAYTPEQIKEWMANAKGGTTPTRGRKAAAKPTKRQRQPA